ncbi:hypothetical protein SDJN03_26704, partial [Cucurbita argyrosperma subsp. sororia]
MITTASEFTSNQRRTDGHSMKACELKTRSIQLKTFVYAKYQRQGGENTLYRPNSPSGRPNPRFLACTALPLLFQSPVSTNTSPSPSPSPPPNAHRGRPRSSPGVRPFSFFGYLFQPLKFLLIIEEKNEHLNSCSPQQIAGRLSSPPSPQFPSSSIFQIPNLICYSKIKSCLLILYKEGGAS